MKTNLEQHIKSQLDDKKLTPSENSWDKLSQLLEEEKPKTKTFRFPKFWTIAVAASVVIFASIFTVNSLEQKEDNSIQIADKKTVSTEISTKKNTINPEEIQPKIVKENEKSVSSPTQLVRSESKTVIQPNGGHVKVKSKENSEIIQTPTVQQTNPEVNLIQQKLMLPEVKKQEEIAVVAEPEKKSKPEIKKSGYVDSDMLLYSVEYNQAISEKNNDNSRLVIIDFNK